MPKKIPKVKLKVPEPSSSKSSSSKPNSSAKPDPLQIPLPPSSAPSPAPSRSLSPVRPSAIPPLVASSLAPQRVQRSPKRSFDESSASSEGSSALESGESAGKRRRMRSTLLGVSMDVDAISELSDDPNEDTDSASSEDEDVDVQGGGSGNTQETLKTPFLSPASSGSSTSSSSLTSLSSMSISPSSPVNIISHLITGGESPLSSVPSPTPSPPPPEPEEVKKEVKEKPLTRRQRKRLGLPKPRSALADKSSAGKIVIPGGRYLRSSPQSQTVDDGDEEDAEPDAGEWRNNGSGRVDVRGFRELKI